jgi:hypothetical protein
VGDAAVARELEALGSWMPVVRHPIPPRLEIMWHLRYNVTACDARLARAPGLGCEVEIYAH